MNEAQVAQYFDEHAETYSTDLAPEEIQNVPLVEEFLASAVPEDGTVLEIGCGDGVFLEYLLDRTAAGSVYGLDISASMLPEQGVGRGHYFQASATSSPLPIRRESFDVVLFRDVLHHLVGSTRSESKDLATLALTEAAALVKPGGHLVVKDISYESPVGPASLTSKAIFYGLKYGGPLAATVDEEAAEGLLVSFYTKAELREMLRRSGLTIVDESTSTKSASTVARRLLIGESACIRLYATKNSGTGTDREW